MPFLFTTEKSSTILNFTSNRVQCIQIMEPNWSDHPQITPLVHPITITWTLPIILIPQVVPNYDRILNHISSTLVTSQINFPNTVFGSFWYNCLNLPFRLCNWRLFSYKANYFLIVYHGFQGSSTISMPHFLTNNLFIHWPSILLGLCHKL